MAEKNVNEQKLSGWFLALGILLILFGFIIIMFPVAGTFTVELLFGVLLLIAGLAQVVMSFQARKWTGFLLSLIVGLLYFLAGLMLLFYPLTGAITLTLLLGVLLFLTGLLRIGMSFKVKRSSHPEWLLFNGILSVLLGLLILMAWPSDALWVIGLLFGIDVLFGGLSFLMLSLATGKR